MPNDGSEANVQVQGRNPLLLFLARVLFATLRPPRGYPRGALSSALYRRRAVKGFGSGRLTKVEAACVRGLIHGCGKKNMMW